MSDRTHVVGEEPKGYRMGVSTWPPADQFAPIDLFDHAAYLSANWDSLGEYNPSRLAPIHGVVNLEHDHLVLAHGEKLFTNGHLGADMLVVPPGAGFPPHVHPGHHLLLCLAGPGTLSIDGEVHDVLPGYLTMVEGGIPHAVGNPHNTAHVLLAMGAPPKELDAEDRMTLVDWNGTPVHVEESMVEKVRGMHVKDVRGVL